MLETKCSWKSRLPYGLRASVTMTGPLKVRDEFWLLAEHKL
jgi:hypothetical protein